MMEKLFVQVKPTHGLDRVQAPTRFFWKCVPSRHLFYHQLEKGWNKSAPFE